MQRFEELVIELQEWLAAGAYDEWIGRWVGPERDDRCGEFVRLRESAAAGTVGTNELRIAKLTDGRCPVTLVT
jgi:hypothetical protein